MIVAERIVRVTQPYLVRASDRFRQYKPEPRFEVRRAAIAENETLKAIQQAWQNFELVKDDLVVIDPKESYERALELIRNLVYTKADIDNLNLSLAEFQGEKDFSRRAGIFLSAMINNGSDSTYTIFTHHLEDLGALGIYNTKTIIIEGDAGHGCGIMMNGGTIVIKGNASESLGNGMTKGKIIIYGNAGDYAGSFMQGGIIKIKGNSGNYTGLKMRNGRITVYGDSGHTLGAEIRAGCIYVMGNVGEGAAMPMYGGEIHINGEMAEHLNEEMVRSGKVFHKGKLIFEKQLLTI